MTAILEAITNVTTIVTGVFDVMVGNPVLITLLAMGLVGAGIGIFSRLRRAAG